MQKLGVNDFGVISISLLSINVGATILRAGLDQTLIQKINEPLVDKELEISRTLMHAFILSMPFIIITLLSILLLDSSLIAYTLICPALIFMLTYTTILSEALKGQARVNTAIVLQNLIPIIFPLAYIMFFQKYSIFGFLCSYLIGYILVFPVLIITNKLRIISRSDISLKNNLRKTKYTGLSQVSYMIGNLALNYGLMLALPSQTFGQLAFMQRFVGLANILMGVINSLTAKNIAHFHNHDQKKDLELYIYSITKKLMIFGFAISIWFIMALQILDTFFITEIDYKKLDLIFATLILLTIIVTGPTTNICVLSGNAKYTAVAALACYIFCFFVMIVAGISSLSGALVILFIEVLLYKGIQLILLKIKADINGHFVLRYMR